VSATDEQMVSPPVTGRRIPTAADEDLALGADDERSRVRRFFPDLFAIEAFVALAMLVALVVLSLVTHPSLEATASREAAGYVPRPEWYFLWLFQTLKYFKGSLEAVGTVLVPLAIIALLIAVPFIDRRPPRTRRLLGRTREVRVLPRVLASIAIAAVLALTIIAAASTGGARQTAPQPAPEWPPASSFHKGGTGPAVALCRPETTRGSNVRVI